MKHLFIALAAAAVICSGCQKSALKPEPQKEPARIPITLSTDIWTKVTDDGYEAGDKVGIYVVNHVNNISGSLAVSGNHLDNTKFTLDGGAWNPDSPVYWKDQVTAADFYCYYPYTQSISNVTAHAFKVKTDQSSIGSYKASEFLWGMTPGATPSEDPVKITTKHAMSNILIFVKPGKGYTEETLAAEALSVTITNVQTAAKVNLATGQVTADGLVSNITPYKENEFWKALVVPQAITESEIVKVTVGNNEYSLHQTVSFESNKQYRCTIIVNKIGEGVNIGIGGWEIDDTDFGGTLD